MMTKWQKQTPAEFSEELRQARKHGAAEAANPMRAVEAAYDASSGRVVVELANGCVFGFPPKLVRELETAKPGELDQVTIEGPGTALRWENLDVDLLVAPLLAGVFGTQQWMREMGRKGGSAKSEAKARAARENGLKGGRPRKAKNEVASFNKRYRKGSFKEIAQRLVDEDKKAERLAATTGRKPRVAK